MGPTHPNMVHLALNRDRHPVLATGRWFIPEHSIFAGTEDQHGSVVYGKMPRTLDREKETSSSETVPEML